MVGESNAPRKGDNTQRLNVSGVLRDSNPVHPYFSAALMLSGNDELADIAKQLKLRVKKIHAGLIDQQSLDECADLKTRFVKLMREVHSKLPSNLTNLVDSRPVNRRMLYERVAVGTEILDVGSGDGRRLKRLVGPVITTLDPKYDKNVLGVPHLQKEFEPSDVGDRIVTSFNSMTQIGEEKFGDVDGIHVVPNHERMIDAGMAVSEGEKIRVTVGGEEFVDHPITLPKLELSSHSCGLNTFKERDLTVTIGESVPFVPFKSVGRRHMGSYFRDDYMTLKMSGELAKLEVSDGFGKLAFREREECYSVACPISSMSCHLEWFQGRYVLLRVEDFRGMRVFHSHAMLSYFLSKVRLKIRHGNKLYRVVAPPRVTIGEALSHIKKGLGEGVVIRRFGNDYLVRLIHGLDLDQAEYNKLSSVAEDMCLEIDLPEVKFDGVCEVLFIPDTGGYSNCGKLKAVLGVQRGATKQRDKASMLSDLTSLPNLLDYKCFLERS